MKTFTIFIILFCTLIFSVKVYSQTTDAPFRGDTAGFVNGKIITRKVYSEMFRRVSDQIKSEKNNSLSDKDIIEAHHKTWDNLILESALEDTIEKKGIIVTDIEVRSSLENDPPAFLKPQFTDSTGKFIREDYLNALHDPHNKGIIDTLIQTMKPQMQKQKLSDLLLASITPTDEELWKDYKEKKGVTRTQFESEKESLRSEQLKIKTPIFFENWIQSIKTTAKIIDYRTVK